MSFTSPLASLYTVLQAVRTSAELNAPLLRKNEAATRAALIDPVLRALGWDTANVQMVEPEKTIGGDLRVDYLLRDTTGKPHLVIEAKCLDASLDKHGYVSKVLGYALGFKVQTVFITDGLSWHCYSNLHKGNTEAITFSLVENLLPAALHLIQWLDAAQSGHRISDINKIADDIYTASKYFALDISESDSSDNLKPKQQLTKNNPIQSSESSKITMHIELGETYYNKGFFNVSQKHSTLLGADGSAISIYLGNINNKIQGDINRRANTRGAPRIFGKKLLANWIKENFKLNDIMKVDIMSTDAILLYK